MTATATKKLNAIASKCRELLRCPESETARAGYRSTLTSIAEIEDMDEVGADVLGLNIIAAWEGLL